MICKECGQKQEEWYFVTLCDRCLKARLWNELELDDRVVIRRRPSDGRISISMVVDGKDHWTDLTYFFKSNEKEEAVKTVVEFFERIAA